MKDLARQRAKVTKREIEGKIEREIKRGIDREISLERDSKKRKRKIL